MRPLLGEWLCFVDLHDLLWRHVHDKDKDYFRYSREERFRQPLEAVVAAPMPKALMLDRDLVGKWGGDRDCIPRSIAY